MSAVIVLEPKLDMSAAEALLDSLSSVEGQDITIDASHVTHLGVLAMQVILSAQKTFLENNCQITVDSPSEAFTQQAGFLGFNADLTASEGSAP